MPPLNPVSKVLRIDFFFTIGNNTRVRDRIFFSYTGIGPTVADLTTLKGTIQSAWSANLASLQNTLASLTQIQITDLTSATAAQVVLTSSVPGTAAGAINSAGVAAVIKFKVSRRYRGGHPRFYFPGTNNSQLANASIWSAGFLSSLSSAWLAFIAACEVAPPANIGILVHVNVSYFQGFTNLVIAGRRARSVPTQRPVPITDGVVSYSVNPNTASQRRRNLQSV